MEDPTILDLTLGSKNYKVREFNLLQQRVIGTALFKAPPIDPANPDKFDFDAEFDSAVDIVFAALPDQDPAVTKAQWLSSITCSFSDLQKAKAAVLKFAGYLKEKPAAQATDAAQQPPTEAAPSGE